MNGCEVHPKKRLAPCDLAALGSEAREFASDTGRKTMSGGTIWQLDCGNSRENCLIRTLALGGNIKNPRDCRLDNEP